MLDKRSWKEFQDAGLIWWCNRVLHLFGWAIVLEVENDGSISNAYPARCAFRGFDSETEAEGFKKVTESVLRDAEQLRNDLLR
jgi:hypothetical protein